MGKRKNKGQNQQKQVHPQQSFQELLAEATLAKLGGYIDEQIQGLGQAVLQRLAQANENLKLRILCTEEIIMEMNPAITKETLADRVATIQDRLEGFTVVAADDLVKEGDRVRVELKTRTQDQKEYQGTSRLDILNVGTGNTLGKELEGAMLGMKAGETKEIQFGKDASLAASITLNRASRKPPKATKAAAPVPGSEADSDVDEGAVNADPNAKAEETANANAG